MPVGLPLPSRSIVVTRFWLPVTSVTVDSRTIGSIGAGLVVLLGIGAGDTKSEAELLAGKIANLRIFSDPAGNYRALAADARFLNSLWVQVKLSVATVKSDQWKRRRRPQAVP